MERSSGIIMHISSLPNNYGIGTLGKEAYEFSDFLKKSGIRYWQILPLGQTSYGDSPYASFSAFAGNPYFIDLDILKDDGLLKYEDYNNVDFGDRDDAVDYSKIFNNKMKVLRIAYENFKDKVSHEFENFIKTESFWLDNYALYMTIKSVFNLKSWQEWDRSEKFRDEEVIQKYKAEYADEIKYWKFLQYEFFKQWTKLKTYVNSCGIKFIGDIPIYVAEDSADTWTNPKMFLINSDTLQPEKVAGCPPDAFSADGQLWGNPIYDWNYMEKTSYEWWVSRMRQSLKLYDVIRIDHFRGFEAYWSIPYGDKTAKNGKWVKGPAMKLFNEIKKQLGNINIIAEDLGLLTDETKEFLKESGFPGMKVLAFAFGDDSRNVYLPHNYIKNCIAYTGTHDNDTVRGWFENTASKTETKHAEEYLKLTQEEGYNWGFIRGVWSSVADVSIALMQDFLNLGNETRMNLPSTIGNNWCWRARKDAFTDELSERILKLNKIYGRCE